MIRLERERENYAGSAPAADETTRLRAVNAELLAALRWIADNPQAHPANVRGVAAEAIAKATDFHKQKDD
jgi:hypothetical protein